MKYFYPYEIYLLEGKAFRKDYLIKILIEAKCAGCSKNLLSCDCPDTPEQYEEQLKVTLSTYQSRRDYWKEYLREGNQAGSRDSIVQYARKILAQYDEDYPKMGGLV